MKAPNPNEPTAILAGRTVTESRVRALCAAIGLPYPIPGGTNDGPNDNRQPCPRHGVRLPHRRRRVARYRRVCPAPVAHGGTVRATSPRLQPLTVRDRERRERLHMTGQYLILFVVVGVAVAACMGGYLGGGHWADHLGGGR